MVICLISGGASGIGRAAALRIARRMPVVVADLDPEQAEATVEMIRRGGHEATGVRCDVRSPADCDEAVAAAERAGPLTDLVSAAGIVHGDDGRLEDCDPETWNQVIGVNLTGAANLVRSALPALARAGGGDVVLVASTAALIGRPGVSAYSASKAGLIGLQNALVADYAVKGIRCNCVCPGPTATPMSRSVRAALANATGQIAQPEQIAAAIDWLTQDDSDWLIGSVLPLDGAETAAIAKAFERN